MFFFGHCCQDPFPCWESQSTSPPEDAFQHCAGLWACCGCTSDSNLVIHLCDLASTVHSSEKECILFCGSPQCPFIYSTESLPSWSWGFNLQLWRLVRRFWFFFLSHTAPGFQLWFYFHLWISVVHWGFSWGCPGGLAFAPVRARCGCGSATWVAGVQAAPGTQES